VAVLQPEFIIVLLVISIMAAKSLDEIDLAGLRVS